MKKKTIRRLLAYTVGVSAISLLGGCGIDQGGAQITASEPGALVVVGPITGFGSVLVNGLTLETAATEILVDGTPVPQSALREGQIIRAVAAVTSRSINATTIEYQENVRGPIELLDAVAGTLTILGQEVLADSGTVLDVGAGRALADLVVGENIEVSGLRLPTGVVQATYLGSAAPDAPLTVTTSITVADPNALTFELGGLAVDYSQVLILDVPMGIPAVGLVVEVEGTVLGPNGELIVEEIRSFANEPGVFGASDTAETSFAAIGAPDTADFQVSVQSVITASDLPSSITLGDVQVSITPLTRVANGTVDDLQPGRVVQVLGDVVALGAVEAIRIELR